MIYDKIANINDYDLKHAHLKRALTSIARGEYLNFESGKNEIEGDNLYAIRVKLSLGDYEEGIFEAHKKYVDIHVPVTNSEDVGIAFVEDITVTSDYDAAGDCLLGKSDTCMDVRLSEGEFLLVFPQDAHKVGVSKANIGKTYEKVIYKVLL